MPANTKINLNFLHSPEQILCGRYGQQISQADGSIGEKFTQAISLVWIQSACNFILVQIFFMLRSQQKRDATPPTHYVVSALIFSLGVISSIIALRWVTYPTEVIGKSVKPIPVLIFGVLLGRKSYSWLRYACVSTIVIGIILFMLKEQGVTVTNNVNERPLWLGELFLALSLAMDGLLAAFQEHMRSSSTPPTGLQMMLAMNFWSASILGVLLLLTGEAKEFFSFTHRHPEVCGQLALLTLCGCFGQFFIYLMVADFGPLACSVVTTTRKFFTVLCSVLFFGNVLNARQWFGAVLVFVGLFADIFYGKRKTANSKMALP